MLILMAISLISPVHPLSWGSGSAPDTRVRPSVDMNETDSVGANFFLARGF